ncbi:Translation initiation factor 5A [Nosema granulosis]|uniref:Translation initiation factor 5A n=1 Tax=Nosema granulosis TaxID=83296 RepID=A0A9P6H0Y8_9MICR|nr:Translation initiation factor 5A [Nosema granulosis]
MENFCKFQEESIDRKDIKPGLYIKIDENKFTRVENTGSCKTGKHGSAKTLVSCKDITTGNNRDLVLTSSDKATVVKMVKFSSKLIDFDGSQLTVLDNNGNFVPIDVERAMDAEDKKKIQETLENNDGVEEFDFVCRALPGYLKLDLIKPSKE